MCERERERRRAEPGGERARARERACVRQRAGSLRALQAAPGFPGSAELPGSVRKSSRPGRFRWWRVEAVPCPAGRDGDPLAGAFQSNLGLALAVSPAVELEGEGCDSPP